MTEVVAVLAVGALCGAWVILQRAVSRWDPAQPGVEGTRCGSCTGACEGKCDDGGT